MKKKLLAAFLCLTMAFSLAACGDSEDAGKTDKKKDSKDDGKKVYQVATDTTFAPFEFENDEGDMVGIDLDILAAIAGMSITDERKEKYDFSDEYYQSGVGMAVKKDSDIDSYEDLKGKTVAAKLGTEGCTFAESIADQYGFTVTQFEDSSTMYQDVISGNTVACFEDYPVMGYEISRGLELKLPLDMEKGAPYGFAVMKGENAELLKMFNAGLANLKESGKYDEILDTYIKK